MSKKIFITCLNSVIEPQTHSNSCYSHKDSSTRYCVQLSGIDLSVMHMTLAPIGSIATTTKENKLLELGSQTWSTPLKFLNSEK